MPTYVQQVSTYNTTAGAHTATITPAVGGLLIVVSAYTAGTASSGSISDDQGGVYSKVESAVMTAGAHTLEVFIRDAIIARSVSTVVTQADPPGADSGGGLNVLEFSGFVGAGTTVEVQSIPLNNQTVSGIPTVTYGGAANTNNCHVAAVFHSANSSTTFTAPASWSERFENGYNSPAVSVDVVTRDSGFTGTAITWAAGSATQPWCGLAVELTAGTEAEPQGPTVAVR